MNVSDTLLRRVGLHPARSTRPPNERPRCSPSSPGPVQLRDRRQLSEATVKTHVNRIFAKTGSRDRVQAAAYAHRHGLAG